ncbi:GALNT6 [Branchiostoma lanceolatum]|uniref:Polypeptide N-acetylgalactosaminyltransferase n=1 Tax=Branchiostoma lanceolatum TaxID=7740 RepID=A0A8J9W8S7_BRALA|nr:GALNT6 [Branchiostoma lanceolatum]
MAAPTVKHSQETRVLYLVMLSVLWLIFLFTVFTLTALDDRGSRVDMDQYVRFADEMYGLPKKHVNTTPALVRPPAVDRGLPGELGTGVDLTPKTDEEIRLVAKGYKKYAFNQYVSDMISVHRTLQDLRDQSIIIVFHNEALSTLLRTVYSVLENTPAELLHEILLVDDFSSYRMLHIHCYLREGGNVKSELELELSQIGSVVRLLRAKRREGLIRARLLGARHATGQVLTFLDSHCECMPGWMEPLLERIAHDHTIVVSPILDYIDLNTFRYNFYITEGVPRGGFYWTNMNFCWSQVPQYEWNRRTSPSDPIRTPTIAGGIFSIHKEYFKHIGTYDTYMDIWGGENLDLSFKVWQCGGSLEILPCSHVGHVFRGSVPYNYTAPEGVYVVIKNTMRVAEVWMDQYKDIYYRRQKRTKTMSAGDLTEKRKLRHDLRCRNFTWYLRNVYPELYVPNLVPRAYGQYFEYTNDHELRTPIGRNWDLCLHCGMGSLDVITAHCTGPSKVVQDQLWLYTQDKTLLHLYTHYCLEGTTSGVTLATCNGQNKQIWLLENMASQD